MLKITVASIPVMDQAKALDFYTQKLGFIKKRDVPIGEDRWLTVVSPLDQDGTELLLEPGPLRMEATRVFQETLFEKGIPWTQFGVEDLDKEFKRLKENGVVFSMEPTDVGMAKIALFEDTCGNRIQLVEEY